MLAGIQSDQLVTKEMKKLQFCIFADIYGGKVVSAEIELFQIRIIGKIQRTQLTVKEAEVF
ncbi:hypothetical protein [Anaerotignum faecicola]